MSITRGALSRTGILLAITTCLTAACDGEHDSDDVSVVRAAATAAYNTHFVLPAYFSDVGTWNGLFSALNGRNHQGSMVIVTGPNSGPPPADPYDSDVATNISLLQQHGLSALGYVNFATPYVYQQLHTPDVSISPQQIANQIAEWMGEYGANGIFLDLSWRQGPDLTTQHLADAEGLFVFAEQTYNRLFSPPTWGIPVMFNWSVPYPEMRQYVDCILAQVPSGANQDLVQFMSQETSQSLFGQYDQSWSWLNSYRPTHFTTIVNAIPDDGDLWSYTLDFATARQSRNSVGAFLTDRADYNALPGPTTGPNSGFFWNLDTNYDNVAYSDYSGSDNDNSIYNLNTCPTPTVFTAPF